MKKDLAASREKSWPLAGYAPGSYFCKCRVCGKEYEGNKRSFQCLECAAASVNTKLAHVPIPPVQEILDLLEAMAANAKGHGYLNIESYHSAYAQGVREAAETVKSALSAFLIPPLGG